MDRWDGQSLPDSGSEEDEMQYSKGNGTYIEMFWTCSLPSSLSLSLSYGFEVWVAVALFSGEVLFSLVGGEVCVCV